MSKIYLLCGHRPDDDVVCRKCAESQLAEVTTKLSKCEAELAKCRERMADHILMKNDAIAEVNRCHILVEIYRRALKKIAKEGCMAVTIRGELHDVLCVQTAKRALEEGERK